MNPPRVSVVIPTYNRAHLIGATIDSVLAQHLPDLEVIVIDDGSTDGTSAVLARYGDRIRTVRHDNRGMNPSRNVGLTLARGEFVALLDSDDLWLPFKMSLQVELLERFPAVGFTFSEFFVLQDASGDKGPRRPGGLASWYPGTRDWQSCFDVRHRSGELGLRASTADFGVYEGCVYERSLHEPTVLPSTALIRRSALAVAGLALPVVEETHGDWEFFARLSRATGALFVDLETTLNRSHEDAVRLTRADPRRRMQRRISMISRVWRADRAFMELHAADVDATECKLLRKLARLELMHSDNAAARSTLNRAAQLAHGQRSASDWATLAFAHLPGSGRSLRALRKLVSGRVR